MTTVNIPARFRVRRRTAADWTSGNEVLLSAEIGLETDTTWPVGGGRKFKIGDGSTAWNSLAYAVPDSPGSGDSISFSIAQTAHGFVPLTPITHDGSEWVLADRDSSATACDLIVGEVTDANNFVAVERGKVTFTTGEVDAITGGSGGFVAGYYWLGATAGTLTDTQPSDGVQCVLKAISTTEAIVMIGDFFDNTAQPGTYTADTVSSVGVSPSYTDRIRVFLCNTGSNNIAFSLPTAVGNTAMYVLKKTAAANTLTITPDGAQTIDGAASATVTTQYESLTLVSDGSNWYVV